MFNPIIRGWLQYYGRYYRSALYPPMRQLDRSLARWADRKYKKLRGHLRRATHWVARISRDAIRSCGRTGRWACGVVPWREPYERRRSSTVLREPRGEIPRGYSPRVWVPAPGSEAERFLGDFAGTGAEVRAGAASEKTRLMEFGRYAAERRAKRGEGKPETFNFLGFTHICGKNHKTGYFLVYRKTIGKRMAAKLKEVKAELQRRMHQPIPEVGKWLQAVVRGHLRYYGVPLNQNALWLFRFQVGRLGHCALSRRSQNGRVLWDRMRRLITRWRPIPTVCHPYPLRCMGVAT